jgi:hypothetical protein
VSPAMKPIGGGSMYQPVNQGLKPINSGSIYKPVNPALQPIGKGGCGKGWVGCNPNSWTPNGGGGSVYVGLGVVAPVEVATTAVSAECYYAYRKVYVPGVGRVRQKTLVCD